MMKKILVIGGAGYIGSHVVKDLLENGFEVLVYDNLSTGDKINLFPNAGFEQGDILDKQHLDQVMSSGVDAVVDLAAKKAVGESMENPMLYAQNNICGLINVLNSMVQNQVKNFVFSSSAAVYGMPEYLPVDENHERKPINFYGFTKKIAEDLMRWYASLEDFHYIALRYFNAVGYAADKSIKGVEKNPQNLLPIIMEAADGKRDGFAVYGKDYDTPDGTCLRDYIHVSDLASAHVAAIKKLFCDGKSYELNLGTGQPVSVLQVVQATEKVMGKRLKYHYDARRPGDPAVLLADASKAREVLNWNPKYTDIEEIIRTVYER